MKQRDISRDSEDYRVTCDIVVRFRDLDALGHVNNAVFLTYFEMGRVEYMRRLAHAPLQAPSGEVFPFILLDVYCRYHSPVKLGETIRVHLRCSRVGRSSFEFEYLVTCPADGRLVASGRSTQVAYDYGSGSTRPLDRSIIERMAALEGAPPPGAD